MECVVWFNDLDKDSLGIAGGKGTNLGIMSKLGLPIPTGFIVTAPTYKEFTEKTGIKDRILSYLKGLDIENTSQLQETAKKIQKLIQETEIPENIKEAVIENYENLDIKKDKTDTSEMLESEEVFVAVRSSATAEDLPEASFAGQQATFLNVKGREDIVKAVSACWASLFTARAIYYREKNNFPHEKVFIAVVVQKMVNSDRSGVMFTINPSNNQPDEIIIEAVHGLGEMIVSGQANPDLYIVNKKDRSIKKIEVRKQEIGMFRNEQGENEKRKIKPELQERQVCDEKEIKELARLGKKIEEHYGKPQDIEWAIEKDEVFIVQSRAVTTFKEAEKGTKQTSGEDSDENIKESGKIILKGETASGGNYTGKVKVILKMEDLNKIEKGDVLVTKMTTPDMVPSMQKAGAIVTDEGGMTCHAAIVSREMGTPCIVGTEHATEVLKDGQEVTVHASRGIVYEGKVGIAEKKKPQPVATATSIPITATDVKVILDLPEKAADVTEEYQPDGVGLVRLEFIIAQGGIHPAEFIRENKDEEYTQLLTDNLRKIASAFKGKPVWVRNSDIRTDEYRNLKGGDQEPKESDPMIGWHAVRRLLDEPRILKAEFKAIKKLHEEGLTNIGIMLPFVINVDEVKKAKVIMREVGLEPCKEVDFGVMIETPASCWVIEELCQEGINFVSFGTNDLTQLTLGIDRNNERIQKLFDEMHPAVLGEIAKVIKTCKKYGVKTSICGQAGSRPEMAEFLVHQGIDSISANADAVVKIRQTVAKTEKKLLLDAEREELAEKEEDKEEHYL